ncbi:MAG TPA: ABC transporter ATP-binding protein [Clostridia bacterium]|nr:ABC transporter ATP-binding protein [Clostridia bacterium]
MTKLFRYLRPFALGLLLAIALLFGQALCDLNLPNYMSDIVNVGIQQNGVEHAAPDAISENGMKLMTSFMLAEEKELVASHYALVDAASLNAAGKAYSSVYTQAAGRIYVRADADEETLLTLDTAFGAATWTMINVMRDYASAQGASGQASMPTNADDIDLDKLYQLLPMLSMLPAPTVEAAHDKALANDQMILRQSGVLLAKAFLSELGADMAAIQNDYIVAVGLKMLAIALMGGIATVLVSLISSRVAAGVAKNLRHDVFCRVESFSNNEFDQFSTASLITRCTNDVTQIQMLLAFGIRLVCYAPIMAVGGTIMALRKSSSMAWIIAAACALLIGVILIVVSTATPRFKLIQKLVDKLNLVSRENLTGLMVIRAFGAQDHEKARFEGVNADLTKNTLFVNRMMVFMMPVMMLIMNGVTLLVVWVGAHQIAESSMQIGDMMAFIQYAMQIIMSFLMISMMFIFLPRAAVSAERIAEVLDTESSVLDPEEPKPFDPAKKGVVEFRNVSFRYSDAEENALSDITFTALPGQTTAIIGPTGSGKSTIASLLLRFYDATEGQVLVDGADVRDVMQAALREKIGYVPQKGVLISGTIGSNLKYGRRDASDDEMETASRVAQATEFINEKPERFDSEIAQGGANVSGGQKQRLSIARALVKKPEILVFDDSFSALDFRTDAALRKALRAHTADSTILVVAQRINTIMGADQILVLGDGKIVGRGTHRELLTSCPEYYEIASSQLSKEELA